MFNDKIVDFISEDDFILLYKINLSKNSYAVQDLVIRKYSEKIIDKSLRDMKIFDLKELIQLLKLSDAFSLDKDKIVLYILEHFKIKDINILKEADTIDLEMFLIKLFRKNELYCDELIVYSDLLETYSKYKEYPIRVYDFIHELGLPKVIVAKDLKAKYLINARKVKYNRELVNSIVNLYMNSGLYKSAVKMCNEYRKVDANYQYLNDRLSEAMSRLGDVRGARLVIDSKDEK